MLAGHKSAGYMPPRCSAAVHHGTIVHNVTASEKWSRPARMVWRNASNHAREGKALL